MDDWRRRVGVVVAPVGVTFAWWRAAAQRLDAAGYAGLWTWDHLASRGTHRPVLEAWTTLAAIAPLTERLTLGTLVTNVMNRHPAVLARQIATLQDASGGRVRVGIGIGGDEREHRQYGIPFPPARERVARLEDAVGVLRALWSGERVTRPSPFTPLEDALGEPVPQPLPDIVVAGQTAAGARMAARAGDAWAMRPNDLASLLPVYREALAAAGREGDGHVLVGFEAAKAGVDGVAGTAWAADPAGELARWLAQGADEVVLTARTDADLDALEAMAGRR